MDIKQQLINSIKEKVTPQEAIKFHLAEQSVEDLEEILRYLGIINKGG